MGSPAATVRFRTCKSGSGIPASDPDLSFASSVCQPDSSHRRRRDPRHARTARTHKRVRSPDLIEGKRPTIATSLNDLLKARCRRQVGV